MKEEFIVVKKLASPHVILGIPFMQRQNVILDFEQGLVKINERFI